MDGGGTHAAIADRIMAVLAKWQALSITDENIELLYKELENILKDEEERQ